MDYQVFFTKNTPFTMYGGGFIEMVEGETPKKDALAAYGPDRGTQVRLEVSNLTLATGHSEESGQSGTLFGSGSTRSSFNEMHDGHEFHFDRFSVLGSKKKTTEITVSVRCGADNYFKDNETQGLGVSLGAAIFDDQEDRLRGYTEGPHMWCEVWVAPETFNQIRSLLLEQKDLNPMLVIQFRTPDNVYLSEDLLGGMPRVIKLLARRQDIVNLEDVPDDFFKTDEFDTKRGFQPLDSWSVIATLPRIPTSDSIDSPEDDWNEIPEVSINQIENLETELTRVQMTLAQVAHQASLASWKGAFGGALIVVIASAMVFVL